MRSYPNIETRKFPGHDYYIGYDNQGGVYHIRKLSDGSWYARENSPTNGVNSVGGKTLKIVSEKLARVYHV